MELWESGECLMPERDNVDQWILMDLGGPVRECNA